MPLLKASRPHRDNGRRIARARRSYGESQASFAEALGISRRHMVRLEMGEHRPADGLRNLIVAITGTDENIESSDDEQADLALLNAVKRMVTLRRLTGDQLAVCK